MIRAVCVLLLLITLSNHEALGQGITPRPHVPVCPDRVPGVFNCASRVIVDAAGRPADINPSGAGGSSGYGPTQFLGAYGLGTGRAPSGHPIIAIVDAYDNPGIAAELATYSSFYGIPQLSDCLVPVANSAVPCFQKVDQKGGNNYPRSDPLWGLEISLDVEIAHAICQNCSILLVEANSASYFDMLTAVTEAVSLGGVVISNSWSSSEFADEASYDATYFDHQGVAMLFASGDGGYGPQYPAASTYVTAVGGTTLQVQKHVGGYRSETAWAGAGSGCSLFEPKPLWQKDTGCGDRRTIADVSADADPNTGAAVYNGTYYTSTPRWFQVGGTSLATPIVAGVYALSGKLPQNTWASSLPYLNPSLFLHDIVAGSNGTCGTYLCNAGVGYDGPTGLGTPNGTGGF
jgi:subtilase family serine protease